MLLTVTTRVKKHVSSVMDRLTKGGNLTDTTAAPEQSPFVGEMGGATTEVAVVIIIGCESSPISRNLLAARAAQ